jgi:hypothetical protein
MLSSSTKAEPLIIFLIDESAMPYAFKLSFIT